MKIDKAVIENYPKNDNIKKRYLVSCGSREQLERLFGCQKVEMVDTYVKSGENDEIRVRKVMTKGDEYFFRTVKMYELGEIVAEGETPISKEKYLAAVENMDILYKQVIRERLCFGGKDYYYDLDTFAFWNGFAILTIKGSISLDSVPLPKGIEIIKEVTFDQSYTTRTLARIDYTSFLE